MIDWNVLAVPQLRHSHRSSESISLLSTMIMTQEVTEHATRKQHRLGFTSIGSSFSQSLRLLKGLEKAQATMQPGLETLSP